MGGIGQIVPGFKPETALERRVAGERALLDGLAWGEPRKSHPEGAVGIHVGQLLDEVERRGESGDRRAALRFISLVHDAFKYQVRDWLPKSGPNHHAARARRFASRFTNDDRLLATIELHDRPYALWRKMQRRGTLDERRFERMMQRVPDPSLFMRFIELDASTEGKNPEPTRWLRAELVRRGFLDADAPSSSEANGAGVRQ